jgi:hypothetical protein
MMLHFAATSTSSKEALSSFYLGYWRLGHESHVLSDEKREYKKRIDDTDLSNAVFCGNLPRDAATALTE